jgi:hypothetical protein
VIEKVGNFWKENYDYYIVTVNGTVKRDGSAVMGRGVAREAAQLYPQLPYQLGQMIKTHGSKLFIFAGFKQRIMTFPVKYEWFQKADLELIKRSTEELKEELRPHLTFALPRPGCGNGQLSWEVVKPIVEGLPDNVHVWRLK